MRIIFLILLTSLPAMACNYDSECYGNGANSKCIGADSSTPGMCAAPNDNVNQGGSGSCRTNYDCESGEWCSKKMGERFGICK